VAEASEGTKDVMNKELNQSSQAVGSHGPAINQLVVVVVILAVTILVTALTSDVKKTSQAGIRLVNSQPYLPDKIGEWTAVTLEGMTEIEKKVLPEDTAAARRRYVGQNGREVMCTAVLAGADVTSIHRPELCLPGQGWGIKGEWVESIPSIDVQGGVLKVMRMNAQHDVTKSTTDAPARMMFVYWFVGKDRLTPHHWQRILWTTKDRILHNRNHRWAYFLIATAVRPETTQAGLDQSEAESMATLTRFVQDIYPTLKN
jgi:EpsI family protein